MAELRLVFDRHAEQPADDRHRQRIGEVTDHIEPAGSGHFIQESVHQPTDVGFQLFHHMWRERLARQLAQPGVIGRVEEQEPGCAERPRRLSGRDGPLRDRRLEPIFGRRRVPQDLVAVGERAEHGEVRVQHLHRPALPDLLIQRIGLRPARRVEQLHQQGLGFGQSPHVFIVHALSNTGRERPGAARRTDLRGWRRGSGRPGG